jgi:hypothetical protein
MIRHINRLKKSSVYHVHHVHRWEVVLGASKLRSGGVLVAYGAKFARKPCGGLTQRSSCQHHIQSGPSQLTPQKCSPDAAQ